jgi:hypothetical protein
MHLSRGERSMLASFPDSRRAQEAAAALREAGFVQVQVDRISRFGVESDAAYNNPINRAGSLSGLTQFAAGSNPDTDTGRVLEAADPAASGVGDPGYGVAGGKAFLVTLVTGEDRVTEAVSLIKENGGTV